MLAYAGGWGIAFASRIFQRISPNYKRDQHLQLRVAAPYTRDCFLENRSMRLTNFEIAEKPEVDMAFLMKGD
jgi:hypothetical protein